MHYWDGEGTFVRDDITIPPARITMGKSIHGFPFVSIMGLGLRLAAVQAAGAPL